MLGLSRSGVCTQAAVGGADPGEGQGLGMGVRSVPALSTCVGWPATGMGLSRLGQGRTHRHLEPGHCPRGRIWQ